MKKNQSIWFFVILAAVCYLGFDWSSKGEKKSKPEMNSMPAASSVPANIDPSNLSFPQMMGLLSQNMTVWQALTPDSKKKAIEAVILVYRNRQNIAILRSSEFYMVQIDDSLKVNPELQGTDLMSLMKILSVMQYDYFNGQDKDALAKEVLGEKMAETLRARRQTAPQV